MDPVNAASLHKQQVLSPEGGHIMCAAQWQIVDQSVLLVDGIVLRKGFDHHLHLVLPQSIQLQTAVELQDILNKVSVFVVVLK